MAVKTAYWTIAGASVAETANWLIAHPSAGLKVPVNAPVPTDVDLDLASVGNVPVQDALEGADYTVARTNEGVAIRAEFGAIPETAVRRTLKEGAALGGPGQG